MTDTEIKKALECCTNRDVSCVGCPFEKDDFCSRKILQGSLAYINQLEAEADKIAEDYSNLMIEKDELFDEAEKLIKNAKAEAYKEFAERLKANSVTVKIGEQNCRVITVDGIDYFLKEMASDEE